MSNKTTKEIGKVSTKTLIKHSFSTLNSLALSFIPLKSMKQENHLNLMK